MENNYFIKEHYKCNLTDDYKNVMTYTEPPSDDQYQLSVYRYIRKKIQAQNLSNVLELGFGNGQKAMKYIAPFCKDYYGIDMQHSVDYAKKKYPEANWLTGDFSGDIKIADINFDLIYSIDVIEHLPKPDVFLRNIYSLATNHTKIIVSTPERDIIRGQESFGPPENKKHVREWNMTELWNFFDFMGFEILEHNLFNDRDKSLRENFHNWRKRIKNKTCQVIVCRKKP